MLIYVALSSDCCGDVFEGIYATPTDARTKVATSPRPAGIEEWETALPSPRRTRRWIAHVGGAGVEFVEVKV